MVLTNCVTSHCCFRRRFSPARAAIISVDGGLIVVGGACGGGGAASAATLAEHDNSTVTFQITQTLVLTIFAVFCNGE